MSFVLKDEKLWDWDKCPLQRLSGGPRKSSRKNTHDLILRGWIFLRLFLLSCLVWTVGITAAAFGLPPVPGLRLVSARGLQAGVSYREVLSVQVFWSGGEGISSVKACCSNCSTVLLSLTMIRGGRGGAESTYESWPSLAEVSQYFMAVCKRSSNSWLGRIQLCCKHTCRYGSVSYQPRCRSQGASLPASQQFARANSRWLNQMKQ